MKPPRERLALTLEALPNDAPPIIRLRRFLRMALRSYGLRCTRVVALPDDPQVAEKPNFTKLPKGAQMQPQKRVRREPNATQGCQLRQPKKRS
jgi:hypothetical protein